MPSSKEAIIHLQQQFQGNNLIRLRPMFGEYTLYYDNKVVALFCENQLFVKPTAFSRTLIQGSIELSPYPGAKPHFVVPKEKLDDQPWLLLLLKTTAESIQIKPKRR